MKRKITVMLFIVIFFITIMESSILAYNSVSNNGGISFKRITIQDGLSQTTVEYIYQDSDGYMWFGTDSGLNKYDGNTFEVFRYQGEDTNSISGDIIIAIIEDDDGYLWVGTTIGLNRIDRKTGEIKRYLEGESSLDSHNICELFIDSKGVMWITTANGIYIYNKESDDFDRVLYSEEKDILTSQKVFSIVEDSNDIYWIATDNGLNRYDVNIGEVQKFSYDSKKNNNLINCNYIYDLYMDNNNILWCSTIGGGLNRIDTKALTSLFYTYDMENESSIPSNNVHSVLRTQDNSLWIATEEGLAELNDETGEFSTYKTKIYDSTTLTNNYVISLCESKLGTVWVGTDDGLSIFNPNDIFTTYRNDPLNENTIKSNMVYGVYKDDEGYIWIGTKDTGINIIDRKNDRVYRLDGDDELNELLTSERIFSIIGKNNKIYIGTNNGLNIVDKENNRIEKILYSNEEAEACQVRDIMIDSKDVIWLGTTSGIYTVDSNNVVESKNYILNYCNVNESRVSALYEDSSGEIWIGMAVDGGVIRYNPETEFIANYKKNDSLLSYNAVKDINEDMEGNIWIGTSYGLNKFDKKTEEATLYLEKDGLSNNTVYGILVDEQDNLWISTNYGLCKYNKKNDIFTTYSISDGLQGSEFNAFSHYKAKDGEMFFGGIAGLNSFYPTTDERDDEIARVKISEIEVDGELIRFEDEIVLNYNNNNINIGYFFPDYRDSNKNKYAYMMEGIDKEWILVQNRNYINYNNLPSGKYTFKVAARNSNGQWSEETSIDIVKKPSPWKSKTAYGIYFIIVAYIIYNRWNRVKILNKQVEERTKQLNNKLIENKMLYEKVIENEKNKNNYFVNLSHELRTPLNVILSIEQLITSLNKKDDNISKDKLNHYMNVLRGNSNRLLKLINDIIDTSKIESGAYKLEITEQDIVYHVEELALSMKDYIESKEIELVIDPEIEEQIIDCDLAEIEKCVVNILGNAAKFTPKGGKIYISIKKDDNNVSIAVEDTGIGIDKKDVDGIFDRFGQAYNKKSEEYGGSGIGLALTKQIIELHKGKLIVESEVGVGSKFTMVLPLKYNKK